MSRPNRTILVLASFTLSNALAACAHEVPRQLADARKAYQSAEQGPASAVSPAQLHEAEHSLKLAEQTYEVEGDNHRTRDRAYVALRKAQLADVVAKTKETEAKIASLEESLTQRRSEQLTETRENLADERQMRRDAEERAQRASAELSPIADVKQDERGTVITLSGSVLFASDQTTLLPAAQRRLEKVAKALQDSGPNTQIVVEGHTDSRGSPDYNLELSAQRAQQVRDFLVSRGIEPDRIRAQGLGLTRPVATNTTAEGRANNRRVEIVVEPKS
jgi:outer membrane protein OmpA-like peptidoglycan-associated protein